MNTIEKISISKNDFERYVKETCSKCDNKDKDLCRITRRLDNTVKCDEYKKV